jgi:integrase
VPRRAKGPRLYLDPTRREYAIRDGSCFIRTGCPESDVAGAERQLAEYIGIKHRPESSGSPLIADVLNVYATEHLPTIRSARDTLYHINWLAGRLGHLRLSGITAGVCREVARGWSPSASRRYLETLRAAVRYWHRERGPLAAMPSIVLPPRRPARSRWLTRSEAARLLQGAKERHLRRFILLGLYTGSRSAVILRLQWDQIDLTRGIMARTRQGEVAHDKKRAPDVRLGRRILAHLARWRHLDGGQGFLVRYDGNGYIPNPIGRIGSVKRAWATARIAAGLGPEVTPHILRHTRATWMMQAGVPIWEAAGALGMSTETLERVYGKHSPDWQKNAAEV